VLPDGTVEHLESISQPGFPVSEELVEVVATQIDVTERKRAEQALRESEYKLRQIIETVPGLVWSTAPDGEPTHINQRILDYSGMRFEDFGHLGWEAFVHPADFPKTAKAFYQAIQTGTSYETVHRLRRSDGEYRWHHARREPLRDREGNIIQWYGLAVEHCGKANTSSVKSSKRYQASSGQRMQPAKRPNSIIAFWTTAACDWMTFGMVVGRHSCTRPTLEKLQGLFIR
jgi:PAS domain S-box-containing protein